MAKADHIISFILPVPLLSLDTRSERHDKGWDHLWQGYGYDIRSGGTIYSAMDGPGGPILRGDHPWRDRSSDLWGTREKCLLESNGQTQEDKNVQVLPHVPVDGEESTNVKCT